MKAGHQPGQIPGKVVDMCPPPFSIPARLTIQL